MTSPLQNAPSLEQVQKEIIDLLEEQVRVLFVRCAQAQARIEVLTNALMESEQALENYKAQLDSLTGTIRDLEFRMVQKIESLTKITTAKGEKSSEPSQEGVGPSCQAPESSPAVAQSDL